MVSTSPSQHPICHFPINVRSSGVKETYAEKKTKPSLFGHPEASDGIYPLPGEEVVAEPRSPPNAILCLMEFSIS